MRRTVAVAAGVLLAVSAAGGTLRVVPGEGALAKAQAELRKAKAERPDEPWTVVLGAGEYRLSETVRFSSGDSGRNGAPVTWRAEDGAVIRGGADVGPWTDEGGGIVSAALPRDRDGRPHAIDMLFVNGVRASRSVLPKNRGTFKLPGGEKDSWSEVVASNAVLTALGREEWHVGHAVEYTRVGEDAAKVLAAVDPRELQFVQMQVLLDWSQARRRIVGWDGGTRLVKTECFGGRPRHEQYRWCDRSRIRFENVRAGFTDPGDWFCDDRAGRILYRLRAGESAASLRAVAPAGRFSKLLALDGAHDLVFENMAFAFADAPQAKGDDPKRHNQTWQGQSARSYDAGVALANCRDVEFRACRVEHSGNYGFRIGTGCRRVRLVRCSTFDTGAGGVWLGADEIYPDGGRLGRRIIREMYPESCASNVIADCTFRQGGRFQPEGTAIFVTHASDNLITHNLIDDFYYSGITLGYIWGYKGSPSQRNEVSFNRISRIGQDELYDLAAIYTLSASYGTVVSNNVISKVGGNGIYMDEGSEGVLIENNLVTDIDEAGAFMHFGTGCTFRNNIFAFNRKSGLAWASKREAMNVPSSINFLCNVFYTEDAPLIGERTLGVAGVRAHNVWWKPKGPGPGDFAGLSSEEYLSKGGAYGDVVADPLFVDAKNGDFRLKPDSPALKLGFREWDASLAGPRMRSSEEKIPFNALRFGCAYTNPGRWAEMREALRKNLGAFDEVWFSTGVSFPKLGWHERHAQECAAAAADLRSLGIVPSIEIQTIIGHSDDLLGAGDCTGQDWGTMVSADGLAAKRISCPRDPRLIAYFLRVAELHAAWKPGSVWVDDDLSYRNRAPLLKPENYLPGCFCDRCLAGFAESEGRVWARDELTKAIRADPAVRTRWDDYSCAGMGELTRAIAAAVHRVSPETVMGYQYGGKIRPAIPRGLYDGSGLPVRLRPGAGRYWDSDAHDQLYKSYLLQDMLRGIRDEAWIGACCPEIESCPRTFACRTAQGVILEAFENLALGMDCLSMFVADARTDETTDFYADRLFPRLAAAMPFLRSYRDANLGTLPCGFTVDCNEPAKLVATRGLPIVGTRSHSLGPLPDLASINVRMAGSGEVDVRSREYQTRVMQIASSTGLTNFYARCDRASGGRLPVVFEEPVMAFALPRVRGDGTLVTLALVNASIDRQEPVCIRLRGVPAEATAAVWHRPEEESVVIGLERRGADARLRLPCIGAWACGYLDFKRDSAQKKGTY